LKKLLIITLLLNYFLCFSQAKMGKPIGKNPLTEKKTYSSASTNALFDTLRHNTCLDKQFTIVFYVVLDSNGTSTSTAATSGLGQATSPTLALLVTALNDAFRPICVSFKNCTTIYIPNYNYGKTWTKIPGESYVTSTYYTDKTINFYIVDSVHMAYGNDELEGYTYMPTTANLAAPKKDVIVLDKYKLLQGNFAIVKHLMGHYFGLPHTHDEVALPANPPAVPSPPGPGLSQEFADGSNCYTHGDRFCDTEADSGDPAINMDGMGNFYLFPIDNLMSYYTQRCRFTQEQYNWMAHIIMTKRLYLH